MIHRRAIRRPLALALAVTAGALAAAHAAAPITLEFNFQPGDWLVYERRARRSTLEGQALPDVLTDQIQIWCLERDRDEFLLLIDQLRLTNRQPSPVRGVLVRCDTRGQISADAATTRRLPGLDDTLEVLPRLRLAGQPGPDWLTRPDALGRAWRCAPQGADAGRNGWVRVDFQREEPPGLADLLGHSFQGTYWFDADAGCLMVLEGQIIEPRSNRRTQVELKLYTRSKQDAAWLGPRRLEADRWLRMLQLEDFIAADILARPGECDALLARLDRGWAGYLGDVAANVDPAPFLRLGSAERQRRRSERQLWQGRAALVSEWVNQPAAAWSYPDLNGEPVRSELFRDRWLIEGYWSSESELALRALESLRRTQARLRDAPARVVAINVDAQAERGRAAAAAWGRELAHVFAGAGSIPMSELPLVRVIDPAGVVRIVVIGWRPDYADAVQPLLPEQPQWEKP